jgi:hypothetical protein
LTTDSGIGAALARGDRSAAHVPLAHARDALAELGAELASGSAGSDASSTTPRGDRAVTGAPPPTGGAAQRALTPPSDGT